MCAEERQRGHGGRPRTGVPRGQSATRCAKSAPEHRPGLSSDGRKRAGARGDTHEKAGEGATAAESST